MKLIENHILTFCNQLACPTVALLFLFFFGFSSCRKTSQIDLDSIAFKDSLEEKIYSINFPIDSIETLLNNFSNSNNLLGIYIAGSELGNRHRGQSQFSLAIQYHQKSLDAAIKLKDTIYIAQAYNNIGTDLRRIGVLTEASHYHFEALQATERFHDVNNQLNQKNRVMALNGIGNIALSMDYFDEAEKMFRDALKGEVTINSNLGQAINYANIGAIYQKRKLYDSAYYYYDLSMIKNRQVNSTLGIGLCHKHFGEIFEAQQENTKAENEYKTAYSVLEVLPDKWHWLEACLSMSRINLKLNRLNDAKIYLEKAKETAETIQSPEHLSTLYGLYKIYYSRLGNYKDALQSNKMSVIFDDSVTSVQKSNQILDMRINYEREKNLIQIERLNTEKENQARQKKIIIIASVLGIILLLSLLLSLWHAYLLRIKKNKMLKEINKVRSDFFTNITHEFRTPLTIILGHSQQLIKNEDITPVESKYYLSAIEKQGEKMLSLVNQLLEMTKVSVGADKPLWINGNIVLYIKRIVDNYVLFAENKAILLNFIPETHEIEMDFVPHYIDNIFRNLLSNAIKFTLPPGNITVSVSQDDNNVKMSVSDNGIGISEEEQERVFDVFYQASVNGYKYGSGVGLAFTKQLVQRMQGKIEIKSKVSEGSVFTVTLPKKTKEKTTIDKWEPESEVFSFENNADKINIQSNRDAFIDDLTDEDSAEKPIILVVEDNEDIQLYIQSLLKKKYNVVSAFNGVEGFEKAMQIIPDIIITDIMMGPQDGLTLCKEVKSSTMLNHIPVIMVTAKVAAADMLEGLKCGADAYIKKPFQAEELLLTLSNLLELSQNMKDKYMKVVFQDNLQEPADPNMIFLKKVTDIIQKEIANPDLNTQEIADSLNISLSQLNRKVNAISKYSAHSYLLHVKIDHSKKLLTMPEKNVSEVAEACGFFDLAYFSRTFKKQTGYTPSQYRSLKRSSVEI